MINSFTAGFYLTILLILFPILSVNAQSGPQFPKLTVNQLKGLSPTKSFLKIYHYRLVAGSYQDVEPLLAFNPKRAKQTPESLKSDFDLMQRELPQEIKILSQTMTNGKASLVAQMVRIGNGQREAELSIKKRLNKPVDTDPNFGFDVTLVKGYIEMRKEEGVWKLYDDNWTQDSPLRFKPKPDR